MNRENVDSVIRALRRVNLQGSFFGQSVAIRFGLSESDVETLEALIDTGAATAGRLSELTGLTSGAVTRVIDRLEQGGFVRRVPDPADRRRVIVEAVPEKVAAVQAILDRVGTASAQELARYSEAQLALISDFLTKMEEITREEATHLRERADDGPSASGAVGSEHSAPVGGLTAARLHVRSGLSALRLRGGPDNGELYRAAFDGAMPQVRLRDGRVLIQYRGLPFDWRKRVATVALNPTLPWTIDVVGGVQRVEADLRTVPVHRFSLTGGTERVQLEVGRPDRQVELRLVGGTRAIRIERPRGLPIRLKLQGESAAVLVDGMSLGQRKGESTLDTPGWAEATGRLDVEVVGGSKSIEIVSRPAD